MSEFDIDQTIKDSTQSGQEIQIRDNSGKVTFYNNEKTENKLDISELELASNLSSSIETENDLEQLENTNLRRSKRLTKTNPIVRLNNPVNQSDYRKQQNDSICHHYRNAQRRCRSKTKRATSKTPERYTQPTTGKPTSLSRNTGENTTRQWTDNRTQQHNAQQRTSIPIG